MIPLTYGGGINNVSTAESIIRIGFEKISLNSALYSNPKLIANCATSLGSQAVVASIDYRFVNNKPLCFNWRTGKVIATDVYEMALTYEKLGCGELLITNIENENQWSGLDLSLAKRLSEIISKPIVMHGGVGKIAHITSLFENTQCDVGIGSFFMFSRKDAGIVLSYPFLPRHHANIEQWRE